MFTYSYCNDNNVNTYCQMQVDTVRLFPYIVYTFDDPVNIVQLRMYNW
jgi:hypothetical protein